MEEELAEFPAEEDLDSIFPEAEEGFDCPHCGDLVMPEDKVRQDDISKVYFCPHCCREIEL